MRDQSEIGIVSKAKSRSFWQTRIVNRNALIRLSMLFGILIGLTLLGYLLMIPMPGQRYEGPLPALTEHERSSAELMLADVAQLAGTIGPRNVFEPDRLADAAEYIHSKLISLGYTVSRQTFSTSSTTFALPPTNVDNIIAERQGGDRNEEIIVIGAHYDSVNGSPGANDNASGVASMLQLARHFAQMESQRTIRFVAFADEEPPFFQTDQMGSLVYARSCRDQDDDIVAMLSIETIGYYSDADGSQHYPAPLSTMYPDRGDFIGFVSNVRSRRLLRKTIQLFREREPFPSEGAALFGGMPGVGWSDHWAFWQCGYPALMITDTAPFRYPDYHKATDTPDKLDFQRMARVTDGLAQVIEVLANPDP